MSKQKIIIMILCFIVGTFLGYQLTSTNTLEEKILRVEHVELKAYLEAKTALEKEQAFKKIQTQLFTVLSTTPDTSLDKKAWQKLLDEGKK